jgi:hypothetical protein
MAQSRFRSALQNAWLLASCLFGCSSLLGIELPDSSAADGEAGSAPDVSLGGGSGALGGHAGADGTAAGDSGGHSGTAADDAGRSNDGGRTAGDSGGTDGDVGGADAAGGTTAGDGGEGGQAFGPPAEGTRCSAPGALACAAEASTETLICAEGVWISGEPCKTNPQEFCDRATGSCGFRRCERDICSFGQSLRCGPDQVTATIEACLFSCNESDGQCTDPGPDQLIVDRNRDIVTYQAFWPDRLIPVCARDAAEFPEAWRIVRDAVESTWGRDTGAAFQGWSECTPDSPGVELRLIEDCEGELARIPFNGYPGPGARVPVAICRTYFDNDPSSLDPTTTAPSLLRFIAVHAFGHVLGFEDDVYSSTGSSFMMQAIRVGDHQSLTLSEETRYVFETRYGSKPSSSLAGPSGRCLSPNSERFEEAACDGSAPQAWQLLAGQMRHSASASCLESAPDAGPLTLVPCDASAGRWDALHVSWQASGGRCVSVRTEIEAGESPLAVEACKTAGTPEQTFSFEFASAARVRVRQPSSGLCVTIPDAPAFPAWPSLAACDGVHDQLEVRLAQLGAQGNCLAAVFTGSESLLNFKTCGPFVEQFFSLSGPLENERGDVLTRVLTGNGLELEFEATPPTIPPSAAQTFDYYF